MQLFDSTFLCLHVQLQIIFSGKLDVYVEQATRKVANYLGDVLEDQREKLLENLIANGMDLATYLTRFQWDMAKYPIKQSLKNLSDMIAKQVEWIYLLLFDAKLKLDNFFNDVLKNFHSRKNYLHN